MNPLGTPGEIFGRISEGSFERLLFLGLFRGPGRIPEWTLQRSSESLEKENPEEAQNES